MGRRFRVVAAGDVRGRAAWLVVDSEDGDRPVAEFDDRGDAEEHAERLDAGPLDWDEQDAWDDPWDDDWDAGDGDPDEDGDTG